jgi:plastocyanin
MFGKKLITITLAFLVGSLAAIGFTSETTEAKATADATVTLTNFTFTPKKVRIKAGGTVTWTVKEGSHTVRADDDSFDSGTLTAGKSFSKKFDKRGTYKYFCTFHGEAGGHDMAGTVIVTK